MILSAAGPVVIDWTNARGGDPLLDTALTYLILATNGGDAGRRCAEAFARLADVESGIDAAAAHRAADAKVSPAELEAVEQLLAILRRARPPA